MSLGIFHLAIIRGVLAAVVVLAAGFLALNAFWILGSYDQTLPGLYSFKAATLGDGLFLPVGAGALVTWLSVKGFSKTRDSGRRVAVFAGVIAGFFGAFMQASWLVSDATVLNWTIPAPHVFNAAGWWHACFFVVSFAFYSYCLTGFLITLARGKASSSPLEKACEMLVWFAAAGYLSMHVADDYSSLTQQPWLSLIAPGIVLAMCIIAYCCTLGKNGMLRAWLSLPGILFSIGLSLLIDIPSSEVGSQSAVLFSLSCVFVSSLLIPSRLTKDTTTLPLAALMSGFALAFIELWFVVEAVDKGANVVVSNSPILAVALISAGLILVIQIRAGYKDAKEAGSAFALITLTVVYETWMNASHIFASFGWGESLLFIQGQASHALFTMLIVTLLILQAKASVDFVSGVESSQGLYSDKVDKTRTAHLLAYVPLAPLAIGAMFLVVNEFLSIDYQAAVLHSVAQIERALGGNAVTLVLVVISTLVLTAVARIKSSQKFVVVAVLSAFVYLLIFVYVTEARQVLHLNWLFGWAIFAAFGAAVLVGESFISNCTLLRGLKSNKEVLTYATIIMVGCFLVSVGAVVPTMGVGGDSYSTFYSPIIGVLGVIASFVIIPCICAFSVQRPPKQKSRFLTNTPVLGVMQNGISAFLLIVLLGTLPIEICSALPEFFLLVSIALFFILKTSSAFFPLSANAKHLRDKVKELDEAGISCPSAGEEGAREIRDLSRHLQRQAIITVTSFMPWTLTYMVISRFAEGRDVQSRFWRRLLLRWPSQDSMALFIELVPESPKADNEKLFARLGDEAIEESRHTLASGENDVERTLFGRLLELACLLISKLFQKSS